MSGLTLIELDLILRWLQEHHEKPEEELRKEEIISKLEKIIKDCA